MTQHEMKEKIDEMEPWLRKTCWPPMSYVLIPSLLQKADEYMALIKEERKHSAEWEVLYQRLNPLRENFKRLN